MKAYLERVESHKSVFNLLIPISLSVHLPANVLPTSPASYYHPNIKRAFSLREKYEICLEGRTQLEAGKKLKQEEFGRMRWEGNLNLYFECYSFQIKGDFDAPTNRWIS